MTQEEKQLLFIDLCSRLPYDVKGRVYAETTNGDYDMEGEMIFFDSPFDVTLDDINTSTEEIHVVAIGNEDTVDFIEDQQTCGAPYTIDEFEPYLRPMSSMTEEEREEYRKAIDKDLTILEDSLDAPISYKYADGTVVRDRVLFNEVDWLNRKMFDYRGLIPMGLALEAKEGMYINF